ILRKRERRRRGGRRGIVNAVVVALELLVLGSEGGAVGLQLVEERRGAHGTGGRELAAEDEGGFGGGGGLAVACEGVAGPGEVADGGVEEGGGVGGPCDGEGEGLPG